jgi:SpoVK/Ycf46/Vps4 family AAA+-type ATPase
VFGLGSGNSKYDKLSISQYREDMKGWTSDSRKYLLIDENKGIREVRSSKNVQRQTEHSG